MTFNVEKYVMLTYARWARDFQYYDELYKDIKKPQERANLKDIGTDKDFPVKLVEILLDEQYENFSQNFQKVFGIQANIELFEKETVLKKTHIRATIWKQSGNKIILRGYFTDFKYQEKFADHATKLLEDQNFEATVKNGIISGKKKISLETGERLCIVLNITKLGLLEVELMSCDLESLIKKNEIYKMFDDIISKFDTGVIQIE